MAVNFRLTDTPEPESHAFIRDQLRLFNLVHAPQDEYRALDLYARDEQGALIGGLLGSTYWGWLVIDILWVREDMRGQGIGERLVAAAEVEAIRRGCCRAHVDTMDFQAPGFYVKQGYTVWGVLEDLPEGHRRIFYQKRLR